jgi:cytoskeletal protein CcmA (bactofilin family)
MGLGHTVRIKGDIVAGEDLTIDGFVEGHIEAAGHVVTFAPGSHIVGNVEAAEVNVGGHVEGGILATNRVRVGPDGELEGDIVTNRIAIDEGGRVKGRVDMSQPGHALATAAS